MPAKEAVYRAMKFFFYAYSLKTPIHLVVKQIQWEKPVHGWVKLNTDGSSLGNLGLAGEGRDIWDSEGAWIVGVF